MPSACSTLLSVIAFSAHVRRAISFPSQGKGTQRHLTLTLLIASTLNLRLPSYTSISKNTSWVTSVAFKGCGGRGFVAEGAAVAMADVLEQEGRMLADELGDYPLDSALQSLELVSTGLTEGF
jgi:hypothetical protein